MLERGEQTDEARELDAIETGKTIRRRRYCRCGCVVQGQSHVVVEIVLCRLAHS
jgi:hypothetical protein